MNDPFVDGFYDSFYGLPEITAREVGAFYRLTKDQGDYFQDIFYDAFTLASDTKLILVWGPGRGMNSGFSEKEGWDVVSNIFKFNGHSAARNEATQSVAVDWLANKDVATATLKALIDDALTAAGYTTPQGRAVNA